jgi:hypothetical protein
LTSSVTSASYSLTASYTNQAATASYFITSSVTSASLAQTASYLSASSISVRDLIVTNTASIQYLNVTFQSSSIVYSSGSNIFGDAPNDTQTLNGQVNINNSASIQGNLVVSNGITGSLLGTASWAQNFLTSSVTSASLAQSASYFLTSSVTSASYTLTASYVDKAVSASYFLTSSVTSASYALTASYLSASSVGSSSYSETASLALTASYFLTSSVTSASLAQTASYANQAGSASYLLLQDIAMGPSYFSDALAAAAGVPIGGIYRNGNFIQIRIS